MTSDIGSAKTEAISAASSDATTKANNAKSGAISTAAGDATTKANNAKSGAISTAAGDATTKANAAKSGAISTASADATAKANLAKEQAQRYAEVVNSMPAGGTLGGNFLKNKNSATSDNSAGPMGELYYTGGAFTHPNGTRYEISSGCTWTNFEGAANSVRKAFIMFIGSDTSRITGWYTTPPNKNFICVNYDEVNDRWIADLNDGFNPVSTHSEVFVPNENDCIVAAISEAGAGGGILDLHYFAQVNGITALDSLSDLDANADGVINSLDNAAYFPGTLNFNPTGAILNKSLRPAGWFPAYSNSDYDSITFNEGEQAIQLYSSLDSNTGMTHASVPVIPGTTYKISFKYKSSMERTSGIYARLYKGTYDLPDGKLAAIGSNAGPHGSEIEYDSAMTFVDFLNNSALTTSYVERTLTYTADSSTKFVNMVFLNWDGNSTYPLYIKDFKIELEADKTQEQLETVMANYAGAITIGFQSRSGSTSYANPGEGDRRAYIDSDEFGLQNFIQGEWVEDSSIKLGGVSSSGLFLPFIKAQGLYSPNTLTEDIHNIFPGGNPELFNFNNNLNNEFSTGDLDVDYNAPYLVFDSSIKKFGDTSLKCMSGGSAYSRFYSPQRWTVGESFSGGCWVYISSASLALSTSQTIMAVDYNGSTNAYLKADLSGSGYLIQLVVSSVSIKTSTIVAKDTWVYVSFGYNKSNSSFFGTVNDQVLTAPITSSLLAHGTSEAVRHYVYKESLIDELVMSLNSEMSNVYVKHYLEGVPWNTEITKSDLVLAPEDGGQVLSKGPLSVAAPRVYDKYRPEVSLGYKSDKDEFISSVRSNIIAPERTLLDDYNCIHPGGTEVEIYPMYLGNTKDFIIDGKTVGSSAANRTGWPVCVNFDNTPGPYGGTSVAKTTVHSTSNWDQLVRFEKSYGTPRRVAMGVHLKVTSAVPSKGYPLISVYEMGNSKRCFNIRIVPVNSSTFKLQFCLETVSTSYGFVATSSSVKATSKSMSYNSYFFMSYGLDVDTSSLWVLLDGTFMSYQYSLEGFLPDFDRCILHMPGGASISEMSLICGGDGVLEAFKKKHTLGEPWSLGLTTTDLLLTGKQFSEDMIGNRANLSNRVVFGSKPVFDGPATDGCLFHGYKYTNPIIESLEKLYYNGCFYGTRVYNSVWMDIADFIEVEEDTLVEFGRVFSRVNKKHAITSKKTKGNVVGIASDTFGFGVGRKSEEVPQIPIAIGGFVLAYIDKIYPTGTPLQVTNDGGLTKASFFNRVFHPERIIATFYKEEIKKVWHKKVIVDNRQWVKIK